MKLQRHVIKPNSKDQDDPFRFSVFLAGSIEMGAAEDWQTKVTDVLLANERITFLNPRRDEWDSTWEQSINNPQFSEQVNWELDNLEKADVVLFYFSPATISPISLLELGYLIGKCQPMIKTPLMEVVRQKAKLIVCCPEHYFRKGNVDIICSRHDIPVHNTLEEAVEIIRLRRQHLSLCQ
jgi:hypothetical protein